LWLNGGPGSSSLLGMMQEQGPLLINATGGLMQNPYAWTKQANLLALESPGGVGFSYCAAMKTGGNCKNTDISTAKAARAALQDFFKNKFPELRSNDFFITGESYAGVYIPTLTKQILDHAPEINIKGIAVGDPCTDTPSQAQSMDMLWYAHKHGFVIDADYEFLWNNCSHRYPAFLARGSWQREEGRWAAAPPPKRSALTDSVLEQTCTIAHRRFLATTSKGISQGWDNAYINELDLFTDAAALDWTLPGTENYYNAQYLNRADVRKALHVENAPAKTWPGPPAGWEYKSDYNACNNAPNNQSMIEFYRYIAPKLETTIVFNGDVDPCVSYEGTRTAIEKVGFAVLPGGSYRPWFYDKTAATEKTLEEKPNLFGPNLELLAAGAQFGGQVVNYEHNLSFVTVHGSGHMVPQFRPQSAERLLNRLLSGRTFTPSLATDKELGAMSNSEFESFVDKWTNKAKKSAMDPRAAIVV
jgi:serine carboxypeptidase-like clade 1